MLDPIGSFYRIRDFFISYVETSFRISDPLASEARRALLKTSGILATAPFIEPVLRYESSDKNLEDLIEEADGVLKPLSLKGRKAFVELALSGLFDGSSDDGPLLRKSQYAPYRHQVSMLERGIRPGRPGIVTSGTGSGKTESFMLPILAALSNEAVEWQKPESKYLQEHWWKTPKSQWAPRRAGEKRPSAVRALVLYPMNALVEDQMVRLRKTLDSQDAHEVMDARFAGNRLFFGQYTSATPVTGYEQHPRLAGDKQEAKRRARRISRLRKAMQDFFCNQSAARKFDENSERQQGRIRETTRYIFPSIDGGEMVSRWDMQASPPDILVTNASMLGAMLSREIEDAIFDKTREWLLSDKDSYFYLVFDELHLVRGSAGTEIACLIKSLIQRLGLDQPEHAYKLRLLASSASLPLEGAEGVQSRTYLRDLFAPFGTSISEDDPGSTDPRFWNECIIQGVPHIPPARAGGIPSEPFAQLMMAALEGKDGFVGILDRTPALEAAISKAAAALGVVATAQASLEKLLAEAAAGLLTHACKNDDTIRATTPESIAARVFAPGSDDTELALRGLMLARALPEANDSRARVAGATPAFRVHTFIRNIEGLFASVTPRQHSVTFSDFSVERGTSHSSPATGQARGRRLFELLYCEACGDLFVGGQRGQSSGSTNATELLPSAANLEHLPERPGAEYYDDMTLDEFAVFWPRRGDWIGSDKGYDQWMPAHLSPDTGVVELGETAKEGNIAGYLYYQTETAISKGKNKPVQQPSAQPFCCPKCGTDYSNRPDTNRSRSPIRAFRTGVTKSSQLVATELFELLHAIGAEPKGIVFSDSRQDAAGQAMEIERLHLRDLRREILVTTARSYIKEASIEALSSAEIIELLGKAHAARDNNEIRRLSGLLTKQTENDASRTQKVKLDRLLELSQDGSIGRITAELVRLGISPYKSSSSSIKELPWHQEFEKSGEVISYDNALSLPQISEINLDIIDSQYELVDDVIFANTFFALEETGLAYPCLSSDEENQALDAWLRIFASAYRVKENKYFDKNKVKLWQRGGDISNSRIKKIAQALYGNSLYIDELTTVLYKFDRSGHRGGLFNIGKLFLKVTKPGDLFWRCTNCERVHLHEGLGICTRCATPLPEPSGKVEELWSTNFLGKRIIRSERDGVGRFRLRVEELTAQTDDFSDRLRKFKGIFVDEVSELERLASEIDMLSVTTTMEVGIDIGALQTVYQANMPPQRFNYQQRVGRAGRRGQAFSFVVTFCRGRSHDAYYFAHPHAITGDPPPPPFLAPAHDAIPMRLLRKTWLRAAFKQLRDQCAERGEIFPGDLLTPPDVHGEYVTTRDYYHNQDIDWSARLHAALAQTQAVREQFINAVTFDQEQRQRLRDKLSVDLLISEINDQRPNAPSDEMGLARFLAERGLLPMYGMPTRVRNLYVGLRESNSHGGGAEYEWSTMDRDLDLAVFEYAPGAVLVKDKKKHRVVGFTGNLTDPQIQGRAIEGIRSVTDWCESKTYVAICPTCGSACQSIEVPGEALKCSDCRALIPKECFLLYVTPAAFRTDFVPKDELDEFERMSLRTVATVLREGEDLDCGALKVRSGAGVTILQLNDGPTDGKSDGRQFTVDLVLDQRVPVPFSPQRPPIDGIQAIESGWRRSNNTQRWGASQGEQCFGLISKKETDSIHLELTSFDERLTLNMVARKGEFMHLPTRAAAISATQILVNKAALALDVSPDEFEALEPRLRSGSPMLQIADALINGSGLCRRLGEPGADSRTPLIVDLLRETLTNTNVWPLQDFLGTGADGVHTAQCQTSCYRCIQRYGNRRYHGLLDWRLGMAYLRALVTPNYACGLIPGDERYPEIQGWKERACQLAENVEAMRKGTVRYEYLRHSGLPCLSEQKDGAELWRAVVIHPLWRHTEVGAMRDLLGPDWSSSLRYLDTFELERRPLRRLAALKQEES
ncbi:DEAD/DEAH box helicase [Pseudomonas aeruginosa]|nr:DEAD/DEAH box helicase [Pseudomonas aeruginosa]